MIVSIFGVRPLGDSKYVIYCQVGNQLLKAIIRNENNASTILKHCNQMTDVEFNNMEVRHCQICGDHTPQEIVSLDPDVPNGSLAWYCHSCQDNVEIYSEH